MSDETTRPDGSVMRNRRRLGQAVAGLRQLAELTQQQLADKTGVSGQAISNIEHGRQGTTLETLAAIAAALGTTVSGLLGDDRDDRQPVNVALLADIAGRQRHITTALADLAAVVHRLSEASERVERALAEHGVTAPHLWPCGCLINDAGAHRGGCPERRP